MIFVRFVTMSRFFRFLSALAFEFILRFSLGKVKVFSRWEEVQEILKRDLDFLIEPVNKERIDRICGPFILGLDRSAKHLHEREALYKALSKDDLPRICNFVSRHAKEILDSIPKNGRIDVVNEYANRVASRTATFLIGIEGKSENDQIRVAHAMFHEIFLNLSGKRSVQDRAVAASKELNQWCLDSISARHKNKRQDMISRLLKGRVLDDDSIRRTVSGMFVGAIDTTAKCVFQIMSVILKRPAMLHRVIEDLDNPNRMHGWCWEALRFWPHNPIILRQAAKDTEIGGKKIKKNTIAACFILAAMHDERAFPDAAIAIPTRPQNTYLHFGGGLHRCAGYAISGVQIPILVRELLRRTPDITQSSSRKNLILQLNS